MPLKRYRDPAGNLFSLTEEEAKTRPGYVLAEDQGKTTDEAAEPEAEAKAKKAASNKARSVE